MPEPTSKLSRQDLYNIAVYQKAILVCIYIYLLVVIVQFVVPSEARIFLAIAVFGIGIVATVFVFLLALKAWGTGMGILLSILTLIPCIGLIALVAINQQASALLTNHGYEVGLLGANLSHRGQNPASEEGLDRTAPTVGEVLAPHFAEQNMPEVSLIPVVGRLTKGPFQLRIEGKSATLFSADGRLVAFFLHEMADERIILPSFWESIEHLGIVANDGSQIWFVPEKESLSKIKAYLNWTAAIQGDEAVIQLRKQARNSFYWAFGCVALGLTVAGIQAANLLPIHGNLIFHFVWVPALLAFVRGWNKVRKIKQIQQIRASTEIGPD